MSCLIANGRTEQCKDSISGIDAIYFINYEDLDIENVTYAASQDNITLITGVTDLYKYELKGANSFEQNIMSSRENGTTFFQQILTIQMKRQDVATHKNVKFLAYGRPKIVVHTRSNQWFIMGLTEGADVNAGKVSTGSAYGDFNGYELTFESSERIPANFLTTSTDADLANEDELKDLFDNATAPVTIHDN